MGYQTDDDFIKNRVTVRWMTQEECDIEEKRQVEVINRLTGSLEDKWQTVNTSNTINTQQNEVVKSDDFDKVMNRPT